MNPIGDPRDASSGLWSFSLGFYRRTDIAAALIALQDDAGLDVNLILFGIWLGLSGRGRLDKELAEEAERAVRTIRVEVVDPLRALRRRLKTAADTDIQCLRQSIKAIEIDAEKAAQIRLAALAGPAFQADPSDCLTDAEANLALYLGPETASRRQAAIIRREAQRVARNR
jgi:uncharacterized protein (TIGR02444 family)